MTGFDELDTVACKSGFPTNLARKTFDNLCRGGHHFSNRQSTNYEGARQVMYLLASL